MVDSKYLKIKHRPIKNKVTEKCIDCHKTLAKFSPHHLNCHSCWLKYNHEEKGIPLKDLKRLRR